MSVINQPIDQNYYVAKASVLAANAEIDYGNIAVNNAGVIAPAATGVSGSLLLGMSYSTLKETTGSNFTLATPALFLRGLDVWLAGKSADLPTAANLGGNVWLYDPATVKATNASNDIGVILVEVGTGQRTGYFKVRIP